MGFRLAAVLVLAMAAGAPLGAHDVFRFVGTVISWDAKRQAIDVRTRETWDGRTDTYTRHIVLQGVGRQCADETVVEAARHLRVAEI